MTATAVSDGRPDLAALIERVRGASGPDREIDCLIAVAIDGFFPVPPRYDGDTIGYGYINTDGTRIEPGYGGDQLVRHYTSSIDTALALALRIVPDANCHGYDAIKDSIYAYLSLNNVKSGHWLCEESAATIPLAFIAVALKRRLALLSTQESPK